VLTHSKLQSIVWTSRIGEAEVFYRDVLGLTLRAKSDGALVFDVGGGDLRVSPIPSTTRGEHTVLGFAVDDVDAAIAWLCARGVVFERFAGFPHADNGAVLTPDGNKVAWLRDPDGNILSVVQFARGQSRENCDALSTSQS
jgi:catechol 2,3-dioxygenase-like lactoylglutathione lyase family enzyme